ncbi:helix-turn-helix domain-containing protein [Streptomyces sp. NPDC057552]|uniref:helix-turn-helix domain-containing protein n=1 Tax=Streptomyces sp. NPDC057552 TaxID=3350537 RepID=UPI0036771341
MPPSDLTRLAQAVKARRLQLGLARTKAADDAGMSKDTWKRVEEGKPVRSMNYAKIDHALGWATGSCEVIAAGGNPIRADDSLVAPGVTLADGVDRALVVQQVIESASVGITDLDAPQIRALTARIVEDLEAKGII